MCKWKTNSHALMASPSCSSSAVTKWCRLLVRLNKVGNSWFTSPVNWAQPQVARAPRAGTRNAAGSPGLLQNAFDFGDRRGVDCGAGLFRGSSRLRRNGGRSGNGGNGRVGVGKDGSEDKERRAPSKVGGRNVLFFGDGNRAFGGAWGRHGCVGAEWRGVVGSGDLSDH